LQRSLSQYAHLQKCPFAKDPLVKLKFLRNLFAKMIICKNAYLQKYLFAKMLICKNA
jgi:hypothetical protein